MTDPDVFRHITHERRVGRYRLSTDEHRLLSELLDQHVDGFEERYRERVPDLHAMEVPLGQARVHRWYATCGDADSQMAVDSLAYLVGGALDRHS